MLLVLTIIEALLLSTHNISFCQEVKKYFLVKKNTYMELCTRHVIKKHFFFFFRTLTLCVEFLASVLQIRNYLSKSQ